MNWFQRLSVFAIAMALAGCVTLTPAQQQGLVETRAFFAKAAAAYGVWQPGLVVGATTGEGAYYSASRGLFAVQDRMLTSRNRDALLAHEWAHYLLDHGPLRSVHEGDRWTEQHAREIAAHVKGVEVLQRVYGLAEADALTRMHRYLVDVGDWQAQGKAAPSFGHVGGCQEAVLLLQRFPAYAPWGGFRRCAPSAVGQ